MFPAKRVLSQNTKVLCSVKTLVLSSTWPNFSGRERGREREGDACLASVVGGSTRLRSAATQFMEPVAPQVEC